MKRTTVILSCGIAGICLLAAFCAPFAIPQGVEKGKAAADPVGSFIVSGQTQCILTRKAIIAPTVLHPVTDVLVAPGAKVKKGQALVKIDDDEPKADLRLKEANLESAGIALKEAKRLLASVESVQTRGVIPEQRIHEVRTAALKAEKDERAAEAARDASKAELEHYTVEAPIDGIVNRLEVYPGMVSRPGTSVWGEILDLSELDVVCQLSLRQVELVKIGQDVEVLAADSPKSLGVGKVVFIGLEANPQIGTVPALVRLANPQGSLRCQVPVRVRFGAPRKE